VTAAAKSLTTSPPGRAAWVTVGLLWPVAMLNYLDRQMLASMKYSVMADLPSIGTEANWGYMLGQFKWVYAALCLVGGYVADRYSRRWTIGASLFAWSAITWWTGHVTTYHQLLWARSLMGLSEAFYIPAALALIADVHAGATRSRAVGLHQIAIYAGVILGGFGGYVADAPRLGWRMAFDACGLFGVVYAIPLTLMLREPPRSPRDPRPSPVTAGRELLANPSFLLMVAYFTLPAMAGWVVRDWMPAILQQQFHLAQGRAGVVATLYWQGAAIAGAFGGGWLADRWRGRRGRIYVSAIGTGLTVAIVGVGVAGSLGVAVACLVVFGLGYGAFDANNMPILSQVVRPHLRATGYAIMTFASIAAGGLVDWGFGTLRDRRVPLPATFAAFAAAAVVSAAIVLLVRPNPALSITASSEEVS
jgi:MFS family permease